MSRRRQSYDGIGNALCRHLRQDYGMLAVAAQAIAAGEIVVQKIPPAYVGAVRGGAALPQDGHSVGLTAEQKAWVSARQRASLRSGGSPWVKRVVQVMLGRGPLTVREISALCKRQDKPDHEWARGCLWTLSRRDEACRDYGNRETRWVLCGKYAAK